MKNITKLESEDFNSLFPDFQERGMDLSLKRMQMALKAMGEPCKSIPAIQIVGTNGKGSIASFINSSLCSLGIKVGLTTSPHLISWRERISINGELISSSELKAELIKLRSIFINFNLTPFEILIASALDHFSRHQVEVLILEVGLGGRLDATTAHPFRPIIAMSPIGMDHCEQLGDNLESISKEKAAVISPGSTVISARQHPVVVEVLKETVEKQNAQLYFMEPLTKEWELGLHGDFQKQNAAVAKGAIEALKTHGWKELNQRKIKDGLASAIWPGRLQKAKWGDISIIIDCAHNPHAADQLALERKKWEREESGIHWVLAIQKHKDALRMISALLKPKDTAWIVPVPGHSSWRIEDILKKNTHISTHLKSSINAESALSLIASNNHNKKQPLIVIAGSMYLVGDLLKRQVITLNESQSVRPSF